jgi:hypothetical protein
MTEYEITVVTKDGVQHSYFTSASPPTVVDEKGVFLFHGEREEFVDFFNMDCVSHVKQKESSE